MYKQFYCERTTKQQKLISWLTITYVLHIQHRKKEHETINQGFHTYAHFLFYLHTNILLGPIKIV